VAGDTVDTNTVGTYDVTYSIDGFTATATVTVLANEAEVIVDDSTIYVGDTWTAGDNFVSAKDKTGAAITNVSEVTVAGDTVDTNTVGTYDVTYSIDGFTATATVTVLANEAEVIVDNSTIYVDDTWTAGDNFVSAKDKTGAAITNVSGVTVAGDIVDTSAVGTYDVTYSIDGASETATVTVKAIETELIVQDVTIYEGEAWTAEDNFVSATDRDGNPVTFAFVTYTGTVDVNTPGTYTLTFAYNGIARSNNYGAIATANVTVKPILTDVEAKDSTLTVGDTWKAEDNFISAKDKDGNPVAFADVTVTGSVDTNKAGEYKVTYTYDGVEKTVTITVKAKPEGDSKDKTGNGAGNTGAGNTGGGNHTTRTNTTVGSTMGAKTGDTTTPFVWIVLALMAGFALTGMVVVKRKKKADE